MELKLTFANLSPKPKVQVLATRLPETALTPQGNTFNTYAGLNIPFTLDRNSTVLLYVCCARPAMAVASQLFPFRWYQSAQLAGQSHVVGRVAVNGEAVQGSQHIVGNVLVGTTGTMVVTSLNAGAHTFSPQYRQPGTDGKLHMVL